MQPVVRFILGSISVPAFMLAYFSLRATLPYVPNEAMAQAARSSRDPQQARDRLFELLKACAPRGEFAPNDLLSKMSVIHSFENDAGLFGVTHIECSRTQCTVSASALISHSARADECGGVNSRRSSYYGRRRGWNDWFPQGH